MDFNFGFRIAGNKKCRLHRGGKSRLQTLSHDPGALRAGQSILPHWQDVKAGQVNARAQVTACYRTSPSAVRPPSRHSSSHIGTTSPPFTRDYKSVRCDVHKIFFDSPFFSFPG
jgi:hypothetical protein